MLLRVTGSILVMLTCAHIVTGQDVTVSIGGIPVMAGGTGTAEISITNRGATQASAVQWTLAYPRALITNVAVASATNAVGADKTLACLPAAASTTCVLYGMNQTAIHDGPLATVTFTVLPNPGSLSLDFEITGVVASTADGDPIPSAGGGTSLQIAPPVSVVRVICPETVLAPAVVSCSVSIDASSATAAVSITTDAPSVLFNSTVNVPAGADTAAFDLSIGAGAIGRKVTVTTASGSSNAQTQIDVRSGGTSVLLFNAASYVGGEVCSPGSVVSAFGIALTDGSAAAASPSGPLPTSLAGVEVQAAGAQLPLYYASPGQVNFQCPLGTTGNPLQVTLRSGTGDSKTKDLTMQAATPGLYALGPNGTGQGAVLIAGSTLLAQRTAAPGLQGRAVIPGEFLEIYGNGFGLTDTPWTPGNPAPVDRLLRGIYPVRVVIGGVEATPAFVGLAPGSTGLYQINVMVPSYAPAGEDVPISTRVYLPDGSVIETNKVTISIAPAPQ